MRPLPLLPIALMSFACGGPDPMGPTPADAGALDGASDVTISNDAPGPSDGSTSRPAVAFDAPTQNIFDTFDPICEPSKAAGRGIIFCDGFEDGVFSPPNTAPSAANDYWFAASSSGTGCAACSDPAGRSWAESNHGVIDPKRADFGAAGTAATMTKGWNMGIEPSHCLRAVGGKPDYCATKHDADVKNVYVRLYFKLAGVTSTRCPQGVGSCPSFDFVAGNENGNTNGTKFIEMRDGLDTGGITYVGLGTPFEPSGKLTMSTGDPGACVVGTGGTNAGKACASQDGPGAYCLQHLGGPALDFYDHKDEWIYLEWHIKQVDAPDASTLEMWMDACGRDGKGCSGAPTQRIKVTNWTLRPSGVCSTSDALYLNGWNPGSTQGEIQFDEIVARDGDVLDQPIGFMQ